METSKHRLRRAARLSGPSFGLRRSKTDCTNDQAQPRSDYQAEGGAAPGLPHLQPTTLTPVWSSGENPHRSLSPNSANNPNEWVEFNEEFRDGLNIKNRVAGLTSTTKTEYGYSTNRSKQRPLKLQPRRHTAENITSSPIPQHAPHRNTGDMESVDSKHISSEPHVDPSVLSPTRTSSATGSDFALNEQSPFCRPWYPGSVLDQILSDMGTESVRSILMDIGVTDLWLPLSKQLLRRSLEDSHHISEFLKLQDDYLEVLLTRWTQASLPDQMLDILFNHCEFEDDEDVFEVNRHLGDGMVGVVEEVTIRSCELPIVCARKKIARPKPLKLHQSIMTAFIREVRVMRQVDHRHCVRFLGSYTDSESVNILSTPVADMDMAAFLDKPIGDREWNILYKGIDCLCNGLLYLHRKKIRHEDLKPQNVLIHGNGILLTDFGFSLDFSDDSASTTTGRPSAWTERYSALEVLEFEPRNRASDIFSLGCVLVEMVSGLYGHSLSEVKDHWRRTSNGQSSFARNPKATSSWLASLSDHPVSDRLKPIVDFLPALLVTKRLDRPSAQAVVDRLRDLSRVLPEPPHLVNTCCGLHQI